VKNEQVGADESLLLARLTYGAESRLLGSDPFEGLERVGCEFRNSLSRTRSTSNSPSGKQHQKPAIFIHSIRYTRNRDKKSNATAPVAFRILQGIWMLIILNGTPEIPR
jgi:hypothetical protein